MMVAAEILMIVFVIISFSLFFGFLFFLFGII